MIVATVCGLGLLHYSARSYLLHQGFPLDDAWIHAVYAREFARSGLLAYNPGVPATGETSPLWALLLSILHKLLASGPSVVVFTKLFGFALHVGTAGVLGIALQRLEPNRRAVAWAAAGLLAIHPDLIAASVSGMEVPLATFVSALVVLTTVRGWNLPFFALGAMSFVARPETALIACGFPFLFLVRLHFRRSVILTASAVAGTLAAVGLVGLRNKAVSGLMMPATFYVKANRGSLLDTSAQIKGFVDLNGHFALVNSVLMIAFGVAAIVLVWNRRSTALERAGAAMFATGIAFCAASFALIPPIDPGSFYHQRYVLPALALLIAGLPLILDGLVARLLPRLARFVTAISIGALASVLLVLMPARARLLGNDARNIDDVQVAFGRALADAPATDVAWVIDAGASRYFGRPYVVDMMGLNSPDLLRPDVWPSFLEAHQPRFLDLFPGWSSVVVDSETALPGREFGTTTRYTVSSYPAMRVHVLITCEPPGTTGRMRLLRRSHPFRCAP
jgi:hypothetical protein